MKSTILTLILATMCLVGQSKTYKTIKAPEAMACVNVMHGELKAREVVMCDTATTIRFTMEYQKGQNFRFVSQSYLMDEAGKRYLLRSVEGLKLDSWVQSPESGVTDFTMHFEPLPKKTEIFDFVEGDVWGAFMLLGIHDKKYAIKAPTIQELSAANPWTLPGDWFRTDTVTVCGRIEGYDAEQFGFTAMECYFEDAFEKDDATLVLDIAPDGTFSKKFQTSYPILQTFRPAEDSKVNFEEMPFFARPGETVDITVKKNQYGQYECVYNNSSSRDVERWLRNYDLFGNLTFPLRMFKGTITEAELKAESTWQNVLFRLQTASRQFHFTPKEMQLALADVQVKFAYAWMDYMMYHEDALMKTEQRDGVYYQEVIDSVEYQALRDVKNYLPLHRIDFDNPLLISNHDYPILINRMQFARPVRAREYQVYEEGDHMMTSATEKQRYTNGLAALREMMGTDHENMMAQMCTYKNMLGDFNAMRTAEEYSKSIIASTTMTEAEKQEELSQHATLTNMMPFFLSNFSNTYIRQKAEQFYAHKMAQTELSTPLPDAPMADLIRQLSAKYPGRFLYIDFWGMGCGPCRSEIQQSKQMRTEIAKRDDVKLLFIAGERTTEGSDAYKKYVAEWLDGEETVCVTNADFTRLQELFRFNGIPHHETITPDCRQVRDDLQLSGYYDFDRRLKQLKEKLK